MAKYIIVLLLLLCCATLISAEGEADEQIDERWGPPIDGLRCRWLVPEVTVTTAYPPPLVVEVENASDEIVPWQFTGCTISINQPEGGGLLPENIQTILGVGSRLMTERETSDTWGIGRHHSKGPDAPMEGYYHLEPKGRLTLVVPLPWKFHERFPIGNHKVKVTLFRRNPFAGKLYLDGENSITCAPLNVQVNEIR